MGLANVAEPALVALGFTVSCLVNSRDLSSFFKFWTRSYERVGSPGPARPRTLPSLGWNVPVPDTGRYRYTLVSRLLWHVPFLMELWYWNLTYWIYQGARAFSAVHLPKSTPALATLHGQQILRLESRIGLAVELPVQRFFLSLAPEWMRLFRQIYYSHVVLGVAFLGYMYTYRPDVYPAIRRTMAVANALAFAVMTVYRVAPPRLLPPSYGFVDVLHSGQNHTAWTQNRFQLIYAAMPSLHFGNSLLLGTTLLLFSPHRLLRTLAPLWPAAMLLTIVVTANHYILDAVVGACIIGLAWRLNRVLLALRPLEEWGFWLCRADKPPRAPGRMATLDRDNERGIY